MPDGIDINIDINAIPELTPVPDGQYQLQVVSATPGTGKESGRPHIKLQLEVLNEPTAQTIFEYVSLLMDDDDDKKKSVIIHSGRGLGTLIKAFGLSANFNTDELVGKTAWAMLGTEVPTPEFPDARNRLQKWVVPA